MSFASPLGLLALLVVPLAAAAYALSQRRRGRYAVRFPAAGTLLLAAGAVPFWRRHLPAALALLAMTSLGVAFARPRHTVRVPIEKGAIVLVTDHSGSMQATDVAPTRLAAAQAAAEKFIDEVPKPVKIGVVTFAEQPDAVQAPTTDHDAARQVIENQTALGATATGDALLTALDLLRQVNDRQKVPGAIVLLSDGARTTGSDPLDAARQARALGIPIYTVALGSTDATVPDPNGFGQLSAAPDPETMREIAQETHATAYTADDAGHLGNIYKTLGSHLGSRAQEREISVIFALGGLVLLLGAVGVSVRTAGRLP